MAFVDNEGARIHYEVHGQGEPLVLLAGTGFDMSFWDELLPDLSSFRVLRLDNRGSGLSSVPERPFTIAVMARDVLAVLDDVGVDSAHVHGVSLGSLIAQELALRHPHRVRSLVLGATWPGVLSLPGAVPLLPLLAMPARRGVENDLRRAAPYLSQLPSGLPDQPSGAEPSPYPGHASGPRSVLGYRRQLRAQLRYSSLGRLHKIDAPTLVLHGGGDRLIPPANARIVARLVPRARLRLLPDAGHLYHRDQPELATHAVLDFLLAASAGVLDQREVVSDGLRRTRLGRAHLVLMMSDIVASTAAAADMGDEKWADVLDRHDLVASTAVTAQGGTLVKHTGDGVLATFTSTDEAVAAAQQMLGSCQALGLRLRVGIHTGSCDVRYGDISGLAVHVVARVMSTAGAAEIRLSSEAAASFTRSQELVAHGPASLKGLPTPLALFSFLGGSPAPQS